MSLSSPWTLQAATDKQRTFLSQLNPKDSSSGHTHVNLIIIIKVLLAQQCKLRAQCINLVKITERSQVMERAGESFFISLPEDGEGEKPTDLSAVLSHHKRGFQSLPPHPQLLEDTLKDTSNPTHRLKFLPLKDNTILFYYGIFKQRNRQKKKNITMSRKVGKVTLGRQGLLFSP